MKKSKLLSAICFACIFVMLTHNSYAQVPNWAWAKSAGGSSNEAANSIDVDSSGNIYVIGRFNSPSITFGSDTLINAGFVDMFIVKYDPNGNVIWAKSVGGADDDYAYSVNADIYGNIYVTGSFFSQTIAFDSIVLTNAGNGDLFIAKYDANNGKVLWAKNAVGGKADEAYSVVADAFGNISLTGYFYSDSIAFDSIVLFNSGDVDIFIAKFDSSSNLLWAKSAGGIGSEKGLSITSDNDENIYLAGYYGSSSIAFDTSVLINAGNFDLFLVKYDSNGNLIWAIDDGGTDEDVATSVAVDTIGNIFVTGTYYSSVITFDTTTLNNSGWCDIFIVKFDSTGNVIWAKRANGNQAEVANSIVTDAFGSIYLAGYFQGNSIKLDTTILINQSLNYAEIFIAKYSTSGNVLWAKSAGGNLQDFGNSATIDNLDNFYLAGHFLSSNINFGSSIITNMFATTSDIFLAKLDATTGIQESSTSINPISIYPNPTNGIFTIKANSNINLVEVYNVLGEKIYSKNNLQHQAENQINLSKSPTGIYFVKVYEGEKIYSGKIVVQ